MCGRLLAAWDSSQQTCDDDRVELLAAAICAAWQKLAAIVRNGAWDAGARGVSLAGESSRTSYAGLVARAGRLVRFGLHAWHGGEGVDRGIQCGAAQPAQLRWDGAA